MIIKRIEAENLIGHKRLDVTFPDNGVILITGDNGAGKSSYIEAIAVAAFGKTLRKTYPWHTRGGYAQIETDQHTIRRIRKGTGSAVAVKGRAPFDTPTKAQQWLTGIYGTYDAWKRTHVFSSHDAAHFTLATDAERKRLLEVLLGLESFDKAHTACKKDLKDARNAVSSAEHAVEIAQAQYQSAVNSRARFLQQEQELSDSMAPEPSAEIAAQVADIKADIDTTRSKLEALRAEVQVAESRKEDAEVAHARAQKAVCVTCKQTLPIDPKVRAKAIEDASAIVAKYTNMISEHNIAIEGLREYGKGLSATLTPLAAEHKAQVDAYDSARRTREYHATVKRQLADVAGELEDATGDLEEAEIARIHASAILSELEACDRVLGLRGVRAHVLSQTLQGIENVANGWLARIISRDMTLTLKSYTESKSGNKQDAISMEVNGAGGGHGYHAASGGERRRIDVALLLALADVSSTTYAGAGGSKSLLAFDEVFDSLDKEGVDSVVEALADLAEDRVILVISHSEELKQKLQQAQHIHVTRDGE